MFGFVIPEYSPLAWVIIGGVAAGCIVIFILAAIPDWYRRKSGHR